MTKYSNFLSQILIFWKLSKKVLISLWFSWYPVGCDSIRYSFHSVFEPVDQFFYYPLVHFTDNWFRISAWAFVKWN